MEKTIDRSEIKRVKRGMLKRHKRLILAACRAWEFRTFGRKLT